MAKLTFFRWSLHKTLSIVPDSLERAKISVFYFVFILNYPKIILGMIDHINSGNLGLLKGDFRTFIVTTVVLQVLLYKPKIVNLLIHVALIATSLYVYKALFYYQVDIPILQQVFMAVTFSFYGLGRRWGIFYTGIMVAGIVLSNFFGYPQESYIMVSARYSNVWLALLIIITNFVAIAISHYYFHAALYSSLSEIKALNKTLEHTVKAKGDFLSTMSHELRTPLNAVIGMSNILAHDNRNEEQQENLGILKFSAETLLALINNILDFSKIDSGKIVLEKVPFHLGNLMRNACAGFVKMAGNKGLNFQLVIDARLEFHQVTGDPTRLVQIIFNLVGNALKFTEKGSVNVGVDLLQKTDNHLSIRFSVTDTGIGIKSTNMQMIFEPFLQASESTTRNFGGTGLGLSIVRYLVEMMGGNITLESTEGVGSCFRFDIDYAIADEKAREAGISPGGKNKQITDLRVLVAEDNAMNILFMKKLFATWNLSVTIAENGLEAVSLVENNTFDVVLMDLNMPVMDGYQAIEMIRGMNDPLKSGIHIIVLTASATDEVMNKLDVYKVHNFLSKPFDPQDLKNKLIFYSESHGNICENRLQ